MSNTPKHKLFFGIPYGKVVPDGQRDPDAPITDKPSVEPCWTWDTSQPVFSSEVLSFDCGFDMDTELAKQAAASGFTWDNEVVTMDTESLILN